MKKILSCRKGEGYIDDYKLSMESTYNPRSDAQYFFDWEIEHDGFKYTNADINGAYIYLQFKEETNEILLVEESDSDDDIFLYRLLMSE